MAIIYVVNIMRTFKYLFHIFWTNNLCLYVLCKWCYFYLCWRGISQIVVFTGASPASAIDSDNVRPDDDVQLSNSVDGVYNKVSLFCKLNALLQSAPDNLRTLQNKLDSELLELRQYMDKVEEEMK